MYVVPVQFFAVGFPAERYVSFQRSLSALHCFTWCIRQCTWRLLTLALCLGVLHGAVYAQPVIGSQHQEVFPLGSGRSVPLPEGLWQVTHVGSEPLQWFTEVDYTLRNNQPDAAIPFVVIKHQVGTVSWRDNACSLRPEEGVFSNSHGTKISELINKCSRLFHISNIQSWISTRATNRFWKSPVNGLRELEKVSGGMLLATVHIQQFNGPSVEVLSFIAPTAAINERISSFTSGVRSGAPWPEHEVLIGWVSIFMEAVQKSFLNKSPAKLVALNLPRGSSGTSQLATAPQREVKANQAVSLSAREVVLEFERLRMIDIKDQIAAKPQNPAVLPSSRAPSLEVHATQPPLQKPGVEKPRLAEQKVPERTPSPEALALQLDRQALAAEKQSMAEQLKSMREMLARLQQENAAAQVKAATVAPTAAEVLQRPPSTIFANRKALVVGNDAYSDVPALKNAAADADAMARSLELVGYKVWKHLNVNEKRFKQALREFKQQIEGGDEVLFFYAGHGVQLGSANYLLPTDIKGDHEDQVKDEAILLQRVLDDFQDKKAKFALAVLDACRDNPFKGQGRALGGRGLAPTTAATGQMVMFSAGAGQQALDRLGPADTEKNGLFTRIFVREMAKSGVSVDRVLRNVRTEVVRLAKTVGHEQTPAMYDQAVGEFYFKP